MKKISILIVSALLCLNLSAKSALVVIAHGSPSAAWNNAVLDLEGRLAAAKIPGISYTRVALMEFARPDIADVIRDCELQQVDTVFALPLFISPSGHSEDDIPNILGLKYNPSIFNAIREEGIRTVNTGMHIILGPTLMESGLISKIMLRRVKALSSDKNDEAVIFLAHGDEYRKGFWDKILRDCAEEVKASGFTCVDYRLVGMGQNLRNDIAPLLNKASKERERVIVQGIYLVSAANSMARRAGLEAENIIFGSEGILPQSGDEVIGWIVNTTKEWLASRQQ